MATLNEFLSSNTFTSLTDAARKFKQADLQINSAIQSNLSSNPQVNDKIAEYQKLNQFTAANPFSSGFPGGLSKFDAVAWFNLTKLNLREMQKAPYKIANLLAFNSAFYMMNPSWREGQIVNPLNYVPRPPGLGGVSAIPHALDQIGAPDHGDLVRQRDDLMKTYKETSILGMNTTHGVGDAPVKLTSNFPFIGGTPFATSQGHPLGVTIENVNRLGNVNNAEYPYPDYSPINLRENADKRIDYKSLYISKDKVTPVDVLAEPSYKNTAPKELPFMVKMNDATGMASTKVPTKDLNETINAFNTDFQYPNFSPVTSKPPTQEDLIDKSKSYKDLFVKRDKVIDNPMLVELRKQRPPKPQSAVSWKYDLDSWNEHNIIMSDKVKDRLPYLYLPIFITDLRTNKTAIMKPYIKRITHDFSPNWNILEHFGRVDSIATYKNTKRNLGLDLMMVSYEPQDLFKLKNKMSFLENLVYPSYDSDMSFVSAPVIRIRIGNLISVNKEEYGNFIQNTKSNPIPSDIMSLGCPAIVTQLSYDHAETYPWDIEDNISGKRPKVFGVSLSMIVYHDYIRGISNSAKKEDPPPPKPTKMGGKNESPF